MKDNITKIKKDIWRINVYMQHTYNNTIDMTGLAYQFNSLAASHATLFTILKEVANAKNGERDPTRYARSYKPSRFPPPVALRQAPLALP